MKPENGQARDLRAVCEEGCVRKVDSFACYVCV